MRPRLPPRHVEEPLQYSHLEAPTGEPAEQSGGGQAHAPVHQVYQDARQSIERLLLNHPGITAGWFCLAKRKAACEDVEVHAA